MYISVWKLRISLFFGIVDVIADILHLGILNVSKVTNSGCLVYLVSKVPSVIANIREEVFRRSLL